LIIAPQSGVDRCTRGSIAAVGKVFLAQYI
jgi:hypothetical protein